jgi:hypothetical protein
VVLENRRKYLDERFNDLRNQIRKRAYMKKSKDVSWKSLFDIVWEKIQEKIFTISNVTIPQEEEFSGSLYSAERFLYYLTYERENLLTSQINTINKNKTQFKTKSESLLSRFNNAESQMKTLYKQHFGKPALAQAIQEFSELAKSYYQELLKFIIWERCSLILSGDTTQSGEDERYQKGILNLSKELYKKYKSAYDKGCIIDNWFYQAYLNEHTMAGGVGMISLSAKTDENTIYKELLKNSEKITNLIRRVLEDYTNGVPYELGNINDEKEKLLHGDLFHWCMDYVNEIAIRPVFDDIFNDEASIKEDLKEHLTRALPMIKFDVNRVNATGIQDTPGYCTISNPPHSEALQDYIKNHDSFKNVEPIFLERVDKVYDVDLITASHPYNPSVSQRVQELCGFYNQEKNMKNLHLFPEYSLLTLGGTDEQTQACFDLGMAMEWLKIDADERVLKYNYIYESDTLEIDEGMERETEVYNWKNRANPIYDQLWRSIASKIRDPQPQDSVTVLKDILSRTRKEIERDREDFIKQLKQGVIQFIKGKVNLIYKDVKLGGEGALFKAFAELIARVIGKNPVDVDSWMKKKQPKTQPIVKPSREPQREAQDVTEVKTEIVEKEPPPLDENEFDLPSLKGDEPSPDDMPDKDMNRELTGCIYRMGLPRGKREELKQKCENSGKENKIDLLLLLRNVPRRANRMEVIEDIKKELNIDFSLA